MRVDNVWCYYLKEQWDYYITVSFIELNMYEMGINKTSSLDLSEWYKWWEKILEWVIKHYIF